MTASSFNRITSRSALLIGIVVASCFVILKIRRISQSPASDATTLLSKHSGRILLGLSRNTSGHDEKYNRFGPVGPQVVLVNLSDLTLRHGWKVLIGPGHVGDGDFDIVKSTDNDSIWILQREDAFSSYWRHAWIYKPNSGVLLPRLDLPARTLAAHPVGESAADVLFDDSDSLNIARYELSNGNHVFANPTALAPLAGSLLSFDHLSCRMRIRSDAQNHYGVIMMTDSLRPSGTLIVVNLRTLRVEGVMNGNSVAWPTDDQSFWFTRRSDDRYIELCRFNPVTEQIVDVPQFLGEKKADLLEASPTSDVLVFAGSKLNFRSPGSESPALQLIGFPNKDATWSIPVPAYVRSACWLEAKKR